MPYTLHYVARAPQERLLLETDWIALRWVYWLHVVNPVAGCVLVGWQMLALGTENVPCSGYSACADPEIGLEP